MKASITKAVALVATAFFFYPALLALFQRWREPVSYFDHAILVPFVCGWMVWRSMRSAPKEAASGSRAGLPLVLFALFLELVAMGQEIAAVHGMALVLFVWGAVLWFFGPQVFKRYLWPLSYLLLLIPIPTFFMAQLTIGMRQLSTSLASASIHLVTAVFGVPFQRVGNVLHFGTHVVTIVDACSGMNTLITIVAIGMIIAYLEKSKGKALLIAALLIPVAIFSNLIRILVICVFVALGMGKFAFGAGHSLIGLSTVAAAFALLAFGVRFPVGYALKQVTGKKTLKRRAPVISPKKGRWKLSGFAILMVCAALASYRARGGAEITAASGVDKSLPDLRLPHWKHTELAVDPAIFGIVGTADAHMFRFETSKSDNTPVFLYWLHSWNSRKIGHPPELCYRGDGYEILEKQKTALVVKDREIPAVRMVVQRGHYRLLVYYWYRIGGVETASYLRQQAQWAWNRIKRLAFSGVSQEGSMIRISTAVDGRLPAPRALEEAESRLRNWTSEEDRLNRN